jgi:general stress protein YciG
MPNTDNEIREETGIKVDESNRGPRSRGFAAMGVEQRREIASKGGKAAHERGTAHEFTSEEARRAGYKGGQARQSR